MGWMFMSLQINKLTPHWKGIRRWGLWKIIRIRWGHEVEPSVRKELTSSRCSQPWENTMRRSWQFVISWGSSLDFYHIHPGISDFSLQHCENKCLLFINHLFIMAAQTKWDKDLKKAKLGRSPEARAWTALYDKLRCVDFSIRPMLFNFLKREILLFRHNHTQEPNYRTQKGFPISRECGGIWKLATSAS